MIGNRHRHLATFLLSAFSCCALVRPALTQAKDDVPESRYENAARTVYQRFAEGRWSSAEVLSTSPSARERQSIEVTSFPVKDCSNEHYKCIFGAFRVFAVPRGTLLPSATYVVAGSSFRVEECYRGDATNCQVALISSNCQGCKEALGGRVSQDPGPVLYFIYNEDFGVTAFGSAADLAQNSDEQRAVAMQTILQGSRGLLSK